MQAVYWTSKTSHGLQQAPSQDHPFLERKTPLMSDQQLIQQILGGVGQLIDQFGTFDTRLDRVEQKLTDVQTDLESFKLETRQEFVRVNERISHVQMDLDNVKTEIREEINTFKTEVNQQFVEVHQHFAKVDEQFVEVHQQFAKVDEQFVEVREEIDSFRTVVHQQFTIVKQELRDTKNAVIAVENHLRDDVLAILHLIHNGRTARIITAGRRRRSRRP
jgi:DNA anti-recombination protein RmuC